MPVLLHMLHGAVHVGFPILDVLLHVATLPVLGILMLRRSKL